jgi:hypothetical protein
MHWPNLGKRPLTIFRSLFVVSLALVSVPAALAETWSTTGRCSFNGAFKPCTVRASADLSYPAWSARYVLLWADGIRQTIIVGSDVRARVIVDGKSIAAEQLPPDQAGHCVIRSVTGNVTKFDSGRLRVVKDQPGC